VTSRGTRLALLAAIAALVLGFNPLSDPPFTLVKESLFFTAMTAALAFWVLGRLGGKGADAVPRETATLLLPAGPLLALGCAQAALGGVSRELSPLLNLSFGAAALLLLLADGTGRLKERTAVLLAAAVTAAGAYSAADFHLGPFIGWDRVFAGAASGGTFGNPLFLADALVLVMPFAVLKFMSASGAARAGWGAAALVLGHSLLVTQARGAWAAAAVASAVLVVVTARCRPGLFGRSSRGRMNRLALLLAVAFGAADFAALSIPGPLNRQGASLLAHLSTLSEPAEVGGLKGRLLMWHATALMARERPVTGWGPGTVHAKYTAFQGLLLARPQYRTLGYHMTRHSHQDYLQLAAERGVVGLGLFLWLAAVWVRGMAGLGRESPGRFAMRAGMLCGLAGWAVDALVNSPFLVTPNQQLFWVALGLGWRTGGAPLPERAPRRIRRRGVLAMALVAVFAVLLARPWVRDLASGAYMLSGEIEYGSTRYLPAVDRFAASWRLGLEERRHWFQVGNSLLMLGDSPGAADAYLRDIATDPDFASSWCNLGLALLQDGKAHEAVAALERAVAIDPVEPELRARLARAYAAAGMGQKAAREARIAETLAGREGTARVAGKGAGKRPDMQKKH